MTPFIEYADGTVANLYTTPVTYPQLDESIALTAHVLQHAIDKRGEVRLTVIGQQMFGALITAHSEASRHDFRADYAALSYTPIDVPPHIRDGVLRLKARLGLMYVACGILIDHQDRWLLVDINQAGQYGWIEDKLPQFQISAAIAELLANPRPSRRARPK
ncbi:hypothetical protein [Streptomyces sp. NPDC002845]